MKQTILNLWQENETLFIMQKGIIMQEMKLSIAQVLKSDLCDCNDAYILVKGDIIVAAAPVIQVAFTTCAPFIK